MPQINGELKRAVAELLGSDPSTAANKPTARIWYNTATELLKYVDSSGNIHQVVGHDVTQTLTNKVLTGNTAVNLISGSGTLTLNTSGTITVPNGTDTLVGKATTDVLTNKTLSGNTAVTLISGSGTLTLNTSGTVTLPNATDTLVGKATTDTLTNKTFDADGTGNSITNIENADIKAAAGIEVNKLAAVTASRALVSDASGFISAATTTSTEIGYVNGVTSAIQTQLDAKVLKSTLGAKGSLISATAASTPAELAVGTSGYILNADSLASTGLAWIAPPNLASVMAYRTTSAQSIAAASKDEVLFNGEVRDKRGEYDIGTGRFTAVSTGYYRLHCNMVLNCNAATTTIELYVYLNGSSGTLLSYIPIATTAPMGTFLVSFNCLVSMNGTSDYVSVFVKPTTNAVTIDAGSGSAGASVLLIEGPI